MGAYINLRKKGKPNIGPHIIEMPFLLALNWLGVLITVYMRK